ncbi:DNA adenine methylase [Cohnella sp.]|uniref:DNA adenine methylase n=1 Tax=Cohnella sp. TaxID=1883426 RepID=UPI0037049DA6
MSIPRILHYPGSKWSMYENWIGDKLESIMQAMPIHHYLESHFGSGAIFFNKPPSSLETINDIDEDVTNLFSVIRSQPDELADLIRWTPWSRQEYYDSYEREKLTDIERARRFLIRCWMARGGKTSDRTGWRHNVDITHCPNRPAVKRWRDMPEIIMETAERLKGVQIERQPATKLLERCARPDVIVYCDPPYILSTRSKRLYKNEMTDDDHVELLEVLDKHPGPVLLSGYAHPIYDDRLKDWSRETKQVKAEAGKTRTEVLWINPIAAEHTGRQLTLF